MYLILKHVQFYRFHIPNKKHTSTTLSYFRKITSGETITFSSVQMHVSDCYIAHLMQPGVKIVFKKTGHKADGGPIVKSHDICLFIMFSRRIYAIGA